jgi:hypothetical protein
MINEQLPFNYGKAQYPTYKISGKSIAILVWLFY